LLVFGPGPWVYRRLILDSLEKLNVSNLNYLGDEPTDKSIKDMLKQVLPVPSIN